MLLIGVVLVHIGAALERIAHSLERIAAVLVQAQNSRVRQMRVQTPRRPPPSLQPQRQPHIVLRIPKVQQHLQVVSR